MSKATIVLADDDPIIRMDLREMLEEHGYTVAGAARNGEEAVELTARYKPDLVLMDVKMPRMGGIKAARLIRRFLEPAIVMLTAYSQKETVSEACQAGVTAYLVKPVSEESLLPTIEIALGQKAKIDGMKQELERLERSLEDRKAVEKAKGLVMQAYSLSEDEAYRTMRGVSMECRLSLGKLAEGILDRLEERPSGKIGNG